MIKENELRKLDVLGEKWDIEIDYKENAVSGISVWNGYGEKMIQADTPFELSVIAKNLLDIANILEEENEAN